MHTTGKPLTGSSKSGRDQILSTAFGMPERYGGNVGEVEIENLWDGRMTKVMF